MSRLREIETRLGQLDSEKYHLPYEWLKAHGLKGYSPEYDQAEKLTAGRRREILDELKALRVERKALKEAERRARADRAAANKVRKAAERGPAAECQICEGQHCLTAGGAIVHHGYRRPGDGQIEGDCFGVGHVPYPATDALVEYLGIVTARTVGAQRSIAGLPELTTLIEMIGWPKWATYKKAELDAVTWERKLQEHRWKLEADFRCFRDEMNRVNRRIAAATTQEAKG